jgi:hypothetical protein
MCRVLRGTACNWVNIERAQVQEESQTESLEYSADWRADFPKIAPVELGITFVSRLDFKSLT